jgi:hypothetical protein
MMVISYFVALPFVLADDGTIVAGGPIKCASANTAIFFSTQVQIKQTRLNVEDTRSDVAEVLRSSLG